MVSVFVLTFTTGERFVSMYCSMLSFSFEDGGDCNGNGQEARSKEAGGEETSSQEARSKEVALR